MLTYSKSGVYLETDHAPRAGKGAIIHMLEHTAGASEPENIRRYFARVVWVSRLSDWLLTDRYGVGAEFCRDVDEFIQLFG
jgi:hypothetical protein